MSERTEWKLLGKAIGTGTGWDSGDDTDFCIYEFEPSAQFPKLPSGTVWFMLTDGLAVVYNDNGATVNSVSLLEALQ